jgi:ribosomal protein L37AE/L43A
MTDTIIVKAPAGTKARWVRKSQAKGQKLSDWVLEAVERPANKTVPVPCPKCRSVVLVSDGPGLWQCAQCGLAA